LFFKKWKNSNKKSEISERELDHLEIGSTQWRMCFMHVLPKGKYPLYRVFEENIILGHPEEHQLVDQGTEEQREKYSLRYPRTNWSIFFNKQEKLKQKYPKK
jgi:hypothetical protein